MSDLIAIPSQLPAEESDLEALELFQQLGAELSSPAQKQQDVLHQADLSEDEVPRFSRLSKMNRGSKGQSKKLSKKEMKKTKIKQKKKTKKQSLRQHPSPAPHKKIKRQSTTKKKSNKSQPQQDLQDDRGSSEFDSSSEDLDLQLRNLNPDYSQQQSPRKRLKKSGRKEKIQEKEGFKLGQLGNDADIAISDHYQSDQEYSLKGRKKRNHKKAKVAVLTNQQIMNAFKQQGVVESEGQDEEGNKNYDTGIEMLHSMKKKSKDTIRINNRLFGDLQMSLQNQEAQVAVPEDFELQLKPKTSNSLSQRLSFLSRAESIKKLRGFDADINMEEFARKADQKAKKSVAKIINSMTREEFHEDLDLEIRVPTVARGKSADIINNTFFLRKNMDKNDNSLTEESLPSLKPVKSLFTINPRKQSLSRQQLFKQIQEQTRLKRSKYISNQELKNSFKKTDLEQLEEARKKIQQKRRKEALSEQDSQQQELDSQIKDMIEKQQKVCGDLQSEVGGQDPDYKAENNSQGRQEVVSKEQLGPSQIQKPEEIMQEINDELEEYNELLQEINNPSEQPEEIQGASNLNRENEEEESEQLMKIHSEKNQDQIEYSIQDQSPQAEIQEDPQKERELLALEQEGIIIRKRRKNLPELIQNQQVEQPTFQRIPTTELHKNQEAQFDNTLVAENQQRRRNQGQHEQQFNNFRKLRKIAQVIARKKKEREMGRQYAAQFIEHEAEEGSDNEEHDDMVKNIDYEAEDKEYEGINLDEDLVELIDNAVDINEEDQFEAFRKYLEDVRMQDRDQIKKIVRGQFWKKHEDLQFEMEQDERKRQERMEEVMNWMKQRQEEEGQGIYLKEASPNGESSDEDSNLCTKKQYQAQDELSESQQIPAQQQMARLTKFLEETMPTIKKQIKPVGNINLFALPESVKRDSKVMGQKTISISKFGSRTSIEANPNKKSTSSLVNQILNKTMTKHKKMAPSVFVKTGHKK